MVNQIIAQSTIEGNVLRLPEGQLARETYLEVKRALELIGGKWKGGKVSGFVFPEDPTPLVKQIIEGLKPNLKKEFQFFATPDDIADELVRLSGLENRTDHPKILEPSAGQGAIIDAIFRASPLSCVDAYELMPLNYKILKEKYPARVFVRGKDFLKESGHINWYDIIIANPPFSKNQDIEHIWYMLQQLAPGGTLVSIASNHWRQSENFKERAFKAGISSYSHTIIDIEPGAFKSSGTMVGSCILVIDK